MAENSRYIMGGLFILFLAFSTREMMSGNAANDASSIKEIPKTSFKHAFTGPTLKVLYCFSWGYKRVFEQYASILHEKYPGITILGDTYPPPQFRMYLASFFGMLKWCVIGMVLANFNVFHLWGMNTPRIYMWMTQNKLYACLMTFFISNTIEGQLISTGAFEIIFNDVPVWSKLETGRIPAPPELFSIIDENTYFSSSNPSTLQL